MNELQTFRVLVLLLKDGSSSPKVVNAIISAEPPGSITTDFGKYQWAEIMQVQAPDYQEGETVLIEDWINSVPYDAWLRPFFCTNKEEGGLSGCARRYLKSLGDMKC